jgi:myo-inositol 2-dehydrogenase / D-chiro-inositol 1-dehydrogenase
MTDKKISTRRAFLRNATSTTTGILLAGGLNVARSAHAAGSDTIRIGLIGCGARGTGAAVNALSTKANVKLVAMADAFPDALEISLNNIRKVCNDGADVPKERQFTGLGAYQKVIDCDVDMVLICTPPGFHPMQFEAAVKAGKHVFMEKPVATDAPGVRRVLAANEEAKKKKLAVAVGHHLHHDVKHCEVVKRIHDGAIGDLMFMRVYCMDPAIWVRPRRPGQSEMEYQIRNWYHFTWLSGDQPVEMHVHDIDVGNWVANAHPVEAQGIGGRQVYTNRTIGEIFDHHAVEFTYANGLKMFSYCRLISGCWITFSRYIHGTKGHADIPHNTQAILTVAGQKTQRFHPGRDGHQLEMDHLMAALLAGQPYNEVGWATDSTMTAILGRMAAYSGQIVKWTDAINSPVDLTPKNIAWDAEPLVKPGSDGAYACAMPGMTKP